MEEQLNSTDEITLKELLEKLKEWYFYLKKQWKVIALTGLLGSLLGLGYALVKKPVYTATLTFALEDEKGGGGLGGAMGLASVMGMDLGGGGGGVFSGSNLTELFKSRAMVEKTLLMPVDYKGKTISMAEFYIQNNEWRDAWEDNPKFRNIQFLPDTDRYKFTRVQDSVLGSIYAALTVKDLTVAQKDKKVAITSIEVNSDNELFAKNFCEKLARQVGMFYVSTKSKKARTNMEILQRQTDSIRAALNGAITGVAVANDNTFGLNPAMNVKRAPSSRRQIDVQANTAILTELVKQLEMAKVTLRKDTPLIQVIDRPILPLKKEKFGKIKGVFIGGFLAGFLAVLVLTVRRVFKEML